MSKTIENKTLIGDYFVEEKSFDEKINVTEEKVGEVIKSTNRGMSFESPMYVPLQSFGTGGPHKVNFGTRELGTCDKWPLVYAIYDPKEKAKTAHLYSELNKLRIPGVMKQNPIFLNISDDPRCGTDCYQVGLTVAHSLIWRDIVKQNLSYALILEDDVVFHDKTCELLKEIVIDVTDDWEVAYLGWLPRSGYPTTQVTGGGVMPWTTHAYFVTFSGAKRLLNSVNYMFTQANLTEFVDHNFLGNSEDKSWNAVLNPSVHKPGILHAIPAAFCKIDFVMISIYNFFLTDKERKSWLLLKSSSPNKVLGVTWDDIADWQGGADNLCAERRVENRKQRGFCTCSEWRDQSCYCNAGGSDDLKRLDLPLLGGGLAYQHRCKERDVEYLPRWFDIYPEKTESCLIMDTVSFSIAKFYPKEIISNSLHESYLGKMHSAIDLYSNIITSLQNYDLILLEAHGVPCRMKDNPSLQCCERDVYVRPRATDFAVVIQILFHNEFKFLIDPPSEMKETFNPNNIEYILDAGGNCGISALFLASIYPDARIITVEPSQDNFSILLRNIAKFPNIQAVNKGLWDKSTNLLVKKGARHGREWDYQVIETNDENNYSIKATTVDNLLREFGLPRFDLIKLDIEGSEKEVFEGGTVGSWLPEVRVLFAELHPDMKEGSDTAVRSHLRNENYTEIHMGKYEVYVKKERRRHLRP